MILSFSLRLTGHAGFLFLSEARSLSVGLTLVLEDNLLHQVVVEARLPFFNHQVEVICLYSAVWSLLFQGEVAGVAQIVNKKSGPEFTKGDCAGIPQYEILRTVSFTSLVCTAMRVQRQ